MMDKKLYQIVKFVDENDVMAVVSTSWLKDGSLPGEKFTLWPARYKTDNRIGKAAELHETPSDVGWMKCPVQLLGKPCGR